MNYLDFEDKLDFASSCVILIPLGHFVEQDTLWVRYRSALEAQANLG